MMFKTLRKVKITSISFPIANCGITSFTKNKILNTEIELFPNPTNDILNINLNFDIGITFSKIEIVNNLGQLIREEEIVFKNKTAAIKTIDLPNGVYLLNLRGDNSFSVGKRFTVAK